MDDNLEAQKLLQAVDEALNRIKASHSESGKDFNIFSILGVEENEVRICMFIYSLIDPRGDHGVGTVYLQEFLKHVLGIEDFAADELKSAVVEREKLIKDARRIDLYIKTPKRAIPIEVKIYAEDQPRQCMDYFSYAENSCMYYLTLDGHEPSAYSKGNLCNGTDYKSISFERQIVEWLNIILKLDETEKRPGVKLLIEQFRENLAKLTRLSEKEKTMEIEKLIDGANAFHTANALADALHDVKVNKLKSTFKSISGYLDEKGEQMLEEDYIKKADIYYDQKSSNYPSITYFLEDINEDRALALKIEVGWHIYFGVCQWNKKRKAYINEPSGTLHDVVKAKSGESWADNETNGLIFWKYLGSGEKGVDFKNLDEIYESLYDTDSEEIDLICQQLDAFLECWRESR